MLLRLQHYDVSIKYRPGKETVLADSLSHLTKRFTLNSQYTKSVHWWQTAAAAAWVRIRPRGHSSYKEHQHWWLVRQRQTTAPKSAKRLVMQGWAFSRRRTGTERRARADSHYHEELHSAKHLRRTPRNGEVQATCQDVRVLERHQRAHGVYSEGVLSTPDQPEQSAGRDTPTTRQPRRSVASASHRPLPPWWEWLRHCYWLLPKDTLSSTSDLQLHQRHGHLSSEAAVWRARHTTQTALWQWTAVRLRRVQDICSRLGIQARLKLTQIHQSNGFAERMVQTVKKTMLKARQSSTDPHLSLLSTQPPPSTTTSPPLPNSSTPGSSDPASLYSPPTHPKIQLSTRTCKPASRRKSSTMTRAPVTFHHSHTAQHVHLQEGLVLSRRGPNRVRTPFALQTVVSYRRNRCQLRDLTAPPKHITWADQASINHTSSPNQQQQISMPATTTAPPPKADSVTPNSQTSDKPAPAQTPLWCSSRHTHNHLKDWSKACRIQKIKQERWRKNMHQDKEERREKRRFDKHTKMHPRNCFACVSSRIVYQQHISTPVKFIYNVFLLDPLLLTTKELSPDSVTATLSNNHGVRRNSVLYSGEIHQSKETVYTL